MGFDLESGRKPDRTHRQQATTSKNASQPAAIPVSQHPVAVILTSLLFIAGVISLLMDRLLIGPPLLLGALLVYLIWNTPTRLRRRQIIDRWDFVVAGGNGRDDTVIDATRVYLSALQPPHVTLHDTMLASGIWRSVLGDVRPFIIVQNTTNSRIRAYRMFVNVRDYGEALQTSWYLAFLPTLWQRLRGRRGLDLDLFDEQDLRAYVTVVHRCFVQAVIDLIADLGEDIEVNRTSKGFLGVS